MYDAVIGRDQHIYHLDCLRRHLGAASNPVRFAFHFELDDYCNHCGEHFADEEV